MTDREEEVMVYTTLLENGYSKDDAFDIAHDWEYDIFPNCKTIGDIAKWIYFDEACVVEGLEMADYITVDWDRLAHDLQSNRGMYINEDGYGIVVE